jgi:hypothetical protein
MRLIGIVMVYILHLFHPLHPQMSKNEVHILGLNTYHTNKLHYKRHGDSTRRKHVQRIPAISLPSNT